MSSDHMPTASNPPPLWLRLGAAWLLAGLALLAVLWAPHTLAAGASRYVATTGANAGDCTSPNPCRSLSYALAQSADGDEIQMAAGAYTDNVTFDRNVSVVGSGAGVTIIQANANPGVAVKRVFTVTAGSAITVTGVTIRHGRVTSLMDGGRGGGAWIAGRLTLIDSVVGPNTASQGGGLALNHSNAHLILSNTQVMENYSEMEGGGIYVYSGTVQMRGGGVVSNTSSGEFNSSGAGGGIYLYTSGSVLTQTGDTQIASNRVLVSWYGGGGLYVRNGLASMTGASFKNNVISGGYGGAAISLFGNEIKSGKADLTLRDGLIQGNQALGTDTSGGGIHVAGLYASLLLENTRVISNYAARGGGVFVNAGQGVVSGSLLLRNTSMYTGGAALAWAEEPSGVLTITNSCIFGNSDYAVTQMSAGVMIAENNWWGGANGPSGAGGGSGDSVGAGVDFTPHLNQPVASCVQSFLPAVIKE